MIGAQSDHDLIGATIAGYRVEAVAGHGSMGTVYRATSPGAGRPVALKLIAPALAGQTEFAERFRREAEAARSIVHPNVVPMIDSGEIDGRPFIAMAFVEGMDLAQLLARQGPLEPSEAVRIVLAVADGLEVAHRRGLVHRDVKPANVLIADGSGDVFLTDFGIAKPADAQPNLTRAGTFLGVADYVAPEQILGEPAGAPADVYALGCLLFHAIEGRPPFARETEAGAIYAKLHEAPSLPSGAPPALFGALSRALARDPADRHRDAGDFGRAVRHALSASPSPATAAASGLARPAAHAPRRQRTLTVALVIVFLLEVGIGVPLVVGGCG